MPRRAASTHCLIGLGRRDTGREGAGEVGPLLMVQGLQGRGWSLSQYLLAGQLISGVCCLWHSLGKEPKLCVVSLVHRLC